MSKKFGKNQVSNSWDIPDMVKCCQDKCCLDICPPLASLKDGPRNIHFKFGQNRVSGSWDIPDMDKSRQDKCCMDKCHHDSWNRFKMAQRTYLQSYVRLIRLPVMFELRTLAISHLMMLRRWRWRWRFHCDYIAYSAQLNWDLAELGKMIKLRPFQFY